MLIKILVIMLVMALFFVCMVVFGWDVMDYDPRWDGPEWKERKGIPEDDDEEDDLIYGE